jgi:hypothetical protein
VASLPGVSCPACDAPTVAFRVPDALVAHAPGDAAAVCSVCLRVHPADSAPATADFSPLLSSFPDGEGGAALALALGLLDSLALNRAAVVDCCEFAERAGVDVHLALDRLAAAGSVDPQFDLSRRHGQLRDFLA